ncbi:DUF2498 family protein [Xenorhabdus bovienii]|nr:DUF2498 family protein [Xenorhabdus bovienii]MDE9481131.1 DUF2498 family protein [Xenorhabdus bovienii]MDE9550268.1 DUF2498 family protein [Xenorhabdus bovienii]MDE9555449.1 DUF2498 family protein [Xenorhabdus bovienii]
MQTETLSIKCEQLQEKANEIIRKHDDFIQGIYTDDIEQKGKVLVFKGEYFLNSDSLPTVKSTAVFNMFKHLAHILSEKYHLADEKFDQVISNRLFIIVRVIREIQTATLLPFIVLYQIDIDRL